MISRIDERHTRDKGRSMHDMKARNGRLHWRDGSADIRCYTSMDGGQNEGDQRAWVWRSHNLGRPDMGPYLPLADIPRRVDSLEQVLASYQAAGGGQPMITDIRSRGRASTGREILQVR